MRTPHDAVLQTKYNKLISIIEKYGLLDLWEDMISDLDGLGDLSISPFCYFADTLLKKKINLKTKYKLKNIR